MNAASTAAITAPRHRSAPLREVGLTAAALGELGLLVDPLRAPLGALRDRLPRRIPSATPAAAPLRPVAAPPPAAISGHHLRAAIRSLRRPANLAFLMVLAAVLTTWWVALRPTSFLGGPATFITVRGTSMLPTLHTGDFVLAETQPSYRVGDLVVYSVPRGQVGAGDDLIHRIVAGSAATGFTLKGDNNQAADPWTVPRSDIVGKAVVVLPGAGNWLLFLHSPLFAGALAAAVAIWMVLSPPGWLRRRGSRQGAPPTPGPGQV